MNFFSCPKVFGKTSESSEYTFLRLPKNQYFYYITESSEIILELEIPTVDPVELKAFFVFTELVKTGAKIQKQNQINYFILFRNCKYNSLSVFSNFAKFDIQHFQCKTVFSHSKMPHWLNRLESAIEC